MLDPKYVTLVKYVHNVFVLLHEQDEYKSTDIIRPILTLVSPPYKDHFLVERFIWG